MSLILRFVIVLFMLLLWGFFGVHAMQRTEDPVERLAWFVWFTVLAPFGIFYYLITRYYKYCKEGKWSLIIKPQKNSNRS